MSIILFIIATLCTSGFIYLTYDLVIKKQRLGATITGTSTLGLLYLVFTTFPLLT